DNASYRYDITPKTETESITEGINNSDNYTADTGYNLCNNNSCNSLHNNSCNNTCNNSYIHQPLYRVQTGAYHNKDNADRLLNSLLIDGFPAFIIYEDGYYKVQVGAFAELSNAIKMERRLRRFHYSTYIVV
uniref:SPOR domain-containing protein n=1 Tax=Lachnospira sp. TaxID=2049031 RepID=UPI004024B122